jgi:hypothetical protein
MDRGLHSQFGFRKDTHFWVHGSNIENITLPLTHSLFFLVLADGYVREIWNCSSSGEQCYVSKQGTWQRGEVTYSKYRASVTYSCRLTNPHALNPYFLLWDLSNSTAHLVNIGLEAQNLLGCTAVFLIECRPTFQRYVLPLSSGQLTALMMEAARTSET